MNRIASSRHAISSWLGRSSRSIIVSVIMLMPWSPAFAQQTQPYHLISTASTNAASIKGTSGQVVTVVGINTNMNGLTAYLKFYDTAAVPTCNTTAVVLNLPVPAGISPAAAGFVVSLPQAVTFLNGIGICVTGAIADNDNSNAPANVAIDVFFK